MHEFDYAKEKLCLAVYHLAVGEDDVRKRLIPASRSISTLLMYDRYLPPALHKDWQWIWHQLTKYGARYDWKGGEREGPIEHTMRRIKKATGAKIATRIYELMVSLDDY